MFPGLTHTTKYKFVVVFVFAHIGFLIKSLLALLKHDVQRAFNSPLVSPGLMNGTTASHSAKSAKPPPPGPAPAPPVPVSAPPVPPTITQSPVRPPATPQPALASVNGTQSTKKKRNEPPVDPVTMYESVKNRIAALEEEEVLEEEEERRFGVLLAFFLCLIV